MPSQPCSIEVIFQFALANRRTWGLQYLINALVESFGASHLDLSPTHAYRETLLDDHVAPVPAFFSLPNKPLGNPLAC